jgi:predicted transcriptional regulator
MMNDHQDTEHFAYDKTWTEIEKMLDVAEKVQNKWVTQYYEAQMGNDKESMRVAARNKKALEGVIKTLRWVLGDKNISHPLN